MLAGACLGLALLAHASVAPDPPIAANTITYLGSADGVVWTATQSGGTPAGCEFADDLDLKPANGTFSGTEKSGVATQSECCELCWNEGLCKAAVFVPGSKTCWLKTAADMAGGAYAKPGVVACTRKRDAPPATPLTIPATVPGDLLTDLQAAGQIGDPLYERNFLNATTWDRFNWTYRATFALEEALRGADVLLVFDGIKMGATIAVNGVSLGVAADQFLRYSYPLSSGDHRLRYGAAQPNVLEVTFDSSIDVRGRFMACTGGWDWAAYSHTFQGGAHTFSKGLWKAVYLAASQPASAAITHVVPQIFYQGSYPTEPLQDGTHGGFRVDVRVFLSAAAATSISLSLAPSWGAVLGAGAVSRNVSIPAGESNATLTVAAPADQVELWWPAGMGPQPLYDVTVGLTAVGAVGKGVVEATRKIGFRYVALVTGNDTDPSYVAHAAASEGTSSHGMYLRVNGAVLFSKGANVIPMEELEGRMADDAHVAMVDAAVGGKFNMLRVWGGGMFLPESFYAACDAAGMLVYHDMQYAQDGHAPESTFTQDLELRHMVRRLASHASIVIWDGCNECRVIMDTPTGIYATFVMTVVAEEDASRAVWPSCPALGWTTGVRMLDALPNGNPLTTPKDGPSIETHGPYQHGTGFPAVNGDSAMQLFDANIPIRVATAPTGPSQPNVFASEFGAIQYSSFESMAPTLAPEHWGLHAGQPYDTCEGGFARQCVGDNVMAERNYPCDSLINVYFGTKPDSYFNTTGEAIFKKQLYQCLLSSALDVKQDIETRRSKNELGILVWQFNEIWPTGGWGSIEYGTAVAGQVLGGRWKPLQYMYARSIFADLMASCGVGGECYVKNDQPGGGFFGEVEVNAVEFQSGATTNLKTATMQLGVGAGTSARFTVDLSNIGNATHMLTAAVYPYCAHDRAGGGRRCSSAELAARQHEPRHIAPVGAAAGSGPASFNEILLAPPKDLVLPSATVTATIAPSANADGTIDISLDATKTALFVTLTTLAQGRFSDNAFALVPGSTAVTFVPTLGTTLDRTLLEKTLRVEHLVENL